METLVLEKNDRLILTTPCKRVVQETDVDVASYSGLHGSDIMDGNPFVKWIVGDYVESGKANQNKQYWTFNDLAFGEYSIKYSPANMIHKQRTPVGFFLATDHIKYEDAAANDGATSKIQALSGMWSHIFPFEAQIIDQADEAGLLFYSMEVRGTHIHCAGDNGCDEYFQYADHASHCEHIKARESIRHIVNPTFRGGAYIVPPVRPGWSEASATVIEKELMQESAAYAEATETVYKQAVAEGRDFTAHSWEILMATVVANLRD